MKTALLLATGRPQVVQVVGAFLQNLQAYGYDPQTVSVYLSIDTSFLSTRDGDFQLDKRITASVKSVTYLNEARRQSFAEEIAQRSGIDAEQLETLFSAKGYSQQRNAALIAAMMGGNDVAICMDDDELPIVPSRVEGAALHWTAPDFFGPHLSALAAGADVTRGLVLGYRSPIPTELADVVPEDVLGELGRALSYGSEVIAPDTFLRLSQQIEYLNSNLSADIPRPFEVEQGPNGKFLLTGNMGINLHAVRERRFPLFYTPPAARGEDAILSLQLSDLRMMEVESYIFHDPFHIYPGMLQGEYPTELEPIPLTPATVHRFCSAMHGWLKYAPLYIKMTSLTVAECSDRLRKMLDAIPHPTRQLALRLQQEGFDRCPEVLQQSARAVDEHHAELQRLQAVWEKRLKPMIVSLRASSLAMLSSYG